MLKAELNIGKMSKMRWMLFSLVANDGINTRFKTNAYEYES